MEIDMPGGKTLTVDDDALGKQIVEIRDGFKDELRSAKEQAATVANQLESMRKSAEAEKAEAVAKAKAEQEAAELEAAKKAGDLEKTLELQSAQHRAALEAVRGRLVRQQLLAEVASNDKVIKTARSDIVDALAGKFTEAENGALVSEEGASISDYLTKYLDERPHLLSAHAPAPSGGTPGGVPAGAKIISATELNAMRQEGGQAYAQLAEDIADGKVQVKEE